MEITIPYHKMLKDSRWKDKRETIKTRDKNKCLVCGETNKLEVHHGYYKPVTPPWDYDDDTLWTLCNKCHTEAHNVVTRIHKTIGLMHPRDYNELVPHLPDAVYMATYGCSQEEYDAFFYEYIDYNVNINSNSEFNYGKIIRTIAKAESEFRGISIDIATSEDIHGSVTVSGPDSEIVLKLEEWFEAERQAL